MYILSQNLAAWDVHWPVEPRAPIILMGWGTYSPVTQHCAWLSCRFVVGFVLWPRVFLPSLSAKILPGDDSLSQSSSSSSSFSTPARSTHA